MKEIKNSKSSFMNNVGIVLFSQLMVKLLGLVYRMVITNIKGFGDFGNGYYSAGFQVYTLLLAISSIGIPNAIAKMVSEKLAVGDRRGAQNIFKTAFILFAAIGIVFSCMLYLCSGFIAHRIIGMDGVEYTIRALSPSIFFVCISSVIRGYFTGMQNMTATSSSQILEQFFKSALTILFVYLAIGQTPEIMAAMANLASSAATVISLGYLLVFYKKNRMKFIKDEVQTTESISMGKLMKTILMISVPISLGAVITSINRIIDTATITRGIEIAFANYIPAYGYTPAVMFPTAEQLNEEAARLAGVLSKSDTLINLPLSLNIAFSTVLVPSVASALAVGNIDEASQKVNYSMLISVILILPCAVGYISLAQPIYSLIYPNASLGADLLQLSAVALIFSALNQTMSGSLQGLGKIYTPATGLLIGCAAKIILNIILIRKPSINIYGAAISSIVCQVIAFTVSFVVLTKNLPIKLSLNKYILKPLFASCTMGIAAFLIHKLIMMLTSSNLIATGTAIICAIVIYFILILALRILSKNDIEMLPFASKLPQSVRRFFK